jgi:hypothetical protein
VIEVTDWAQDILTRSQQAARRFNPNTVIRLARDGAEVVALLAERPQEADQEVRAGDVVVYAEAELDGVLDVEEPHDRLVLKPPGSAPNPRGDH